MRSTTSSHASTVFKRTLCISWLADLQNNNSWQAPKALYTPDRRRGLRVQNTRWAIFPRRSGSNNLINFHYGYCNDWVVDGTPRDHPRWTGGSYRINCEKEAYPLRGKEPRGNGILENNGEGGTTSFGETPPPAGFIYRPLSSQSGDPYATQPPYNPSYKLVDDTIVPQINDIGELATAPPLASNQDETKPEEQKGSCGSYCLIICLIAIVIAAMSWVVYLIAKNPRIARTLQRIANQARKSHEERTTEETPLFRRMFSPVISSDLMRMFNETGRF